MTKKAPQTASTAADEIDDGFTDAQEALLDQAAAGDEVDAASIDAAAGDAVDHTDAEETVEQLRQRLKDAEDNAAKEKARADKAEKERSNGGDAQVDLIEARLAANEARLANDMKDANDVVAEAKKAYRTAYESGDADKLLDAEEALSEARLKLNKLKDHEAGVKQYREKFESEKEQRSKRREAGQGDEYLSDEALASGFTKQAQDWIRENPEFRTSKSYRERAVRAHSGALYKGLEVDTPEYFKFIEDELAGSHAAAGNEGNTQIDDATDDAAQRRTETRQTTQQPARRLTPAAPAARSGNGAPARQSGKTVRLSREEVEAAEISGMSLDEYRIAKYGN